MLFLSSALIVDVRERQVSRMIDFSEALVRIKGGVYYDHSLDCSKCEKGQCDGLCPKKRYEESVELAQECMDICANVIKAYESVTSKVTPDMPYEVIQKRILNSTHPIVRSAIADYYVQKIIDAHYDA